MKTYNFTKHQLSIIRSFFHPQLHQVQLYFTNISGDSSALVDFFKVMGYEPNSNTIADESGDIHIYYYDIPEKFRCKYTTTTETKLITW